jgi:hypothetical protein
MAFRQIKSPALADQSVLNTKLDASSVSGQTATTSLADLDTLLVHTNASTSLAKISASDFIGSFDTSDLAEHADYEYFTDARAQAAVASDIATAVAAEASIARAAETQNANDIAAEITRATAAEGVLTTDLAAEISRATGAESAIDTAYKAADAGLQTQINNIVSNVDPAALDSLSEIVAEFQSQDSALTAAITANANAITSEVTRATTAEGVNATAIATETTRAQGVEATLTSDLASEAATRLADDNALDARVTTNEGDISTLQSGLAAEIATTDGEITTLTNDLATEASTARAAEAANAADINSEATARANADTAIRTDFAAADAAVTTAMETYADTAEADAIATAATDATTKADAAEAAAIASAEAKDVARAATSDAADAALDGRLTTAETDISALETVVGDVANTPLDTTATSLGGAINELHGEINTNTSDIATNTADIATNATDIATNTADIANIISNTDPAALDSLTEIVTAFQAGDNALTASFNTLNTNLSTEISDRTNGDAANATAISNEVTRATAAEGVNATAIANEITNRTAADAATLASAQAYADTAEADAISTAAADATAKANAAEANAIADSDAADVALMGDATLDGTAGNTVTDRIATAKAGAEATAEAYTDAEVLVEKNRAMAAEAANTLNITANAGNIATNTSDIATNATAIATEASDRATADTTLDGKITAEATTARAAELVNANAIAAEETRALAAEAANALAISNEVARSTTQDTTHTNAIAANVQDIATNVANLNTEIARAQSAEGVLQSNIDVETARIDSILTNTDPAALDSLTEIVSAFQSADSTINGAITSLSTTAATDRAAIRTEFAAADTALDTRLTTEEGNVDALEATMGSASLTTTAQTVTEAINELDAASTADLSAINTEISDTQTGAGLNADGTYTAATGSHAIDSATSLKDADNKLDAAILAEKTRAEAAEATLTTNVATNVSNINANAVAIAANVTDIATNATAIAQNASDISAENVRALAAEGVNANAIAAEATTARAAELVNANAIAAETTRATNAEAANATDIASNLTEITATQAGAGLATDGTYTANGSANYISTASTLKDADDKLDAAVNAEETRATAAEGVLTANLANEVTRATNAEAANATAISNEVTRATAAEGVNAAAIATVSTNLTAEVTRATAAEQANATSITNLTSTVNDIISNTDPAALDSLTEIVTAFQNADSTLTGAVAANSTAIGAEETRALAAEAALSQALATEVSDNDTDHAAATTDRAAIRSEFAAADSAQDTVIATKLPLAGGTMSGDVAMGGNMVSGLGTAANPGDAVSKAVLDAAISAQDISVYSTDDLAEGSNEYYTPAKARSAISVNDVAGAGLASYDSSTGVISIDTNESVLDLTDVSDTSYTGKEDFVLRVNANEDGMELVNPLDIFTSQNRQTIPGDGVATTYSLNFLTDQANSMVFVGGVIQDPVTHYTINSSARTITFNSALPVGTAAVVVANASGLQPVLVAGQVTFDKFSSDIKAYVQKSSVSATGSTTVDSFNATLYRSAKYVIQVGDANGNYETREALVVHDGTTAYITEYAMVYTGNDLIGDASVNMNGNSVELTYTPTSGSADVKVIATYIDV